MIACLFTCGWMDHRATRIRKCVCYRKLDILLSHSSCATYTNIGAEFYRWEFGTAVSGMILKINPFDELNVTESKNNTDRLLDSFKEQGRL